MRRRVLWVGPRLYLVEGPDKAAPLLCCVVLFALFACYGTTRQSSDLPSVCAASAWYAAPRACTPISIPRLHARLLHGDLIAVMRVWLCCYCRRARGGKLGIYYFTSASDVVLC